MDTRHHRLFTAESGSNRVLVYNLTDTNKLPDKQPDNVLGQPGFNTKDAHTTRSGLNCWYSCGLGYDDERNLLFVADEGNCRVLIFDLASGLSNGMDASYVIGQVDFNSSVAARTVNGLSRLNGDVVYDGTTKRLFVSDAIQNSRVLVYDLTKLTNYPAASYVLGQSNFTERVDGTPVFTWGYTEGVTNNATYMDAGGLALDTASQRLFVSDQGNNYVMVFNVAPSVIKNTNKPDYNIGYRNVYTWQLLYHVLHWTIGVNPANTDRNNAINVSGLGFDQDRKMLYVQRNVNVGIFDVAEITSGEDAVGHHGGTDRESVGMGFDPINRWLYVPFNDGRLYIYEYLHMTTDSLPSALIDKPYNQTISIAGAQGKVDRVGVVAGQLPPGLAIDDAGNISGTPNRIGSYGFDYKVTDDNGDNGLFADTKRYVIDVRATSSPVLWADAKEDSTNQTVAHRDFSSVPGTIANVSSKNDKDFDYMQTISVAALVAAIILVAAAVFYRIRVGIKHKD